jgi:hypothetical protein
MHDLVDLALLGLTSDRPRPLATLIASVKRAGGAGFTPTADFIETRARGLLDKGFVGCCPPDDELAATASGRVEIVRLLRLELDPGAVRLRWFCTSLKLCFLELVDAETRREIAGALCDARSCCPEGGSEAATPACPLMIRYLAIEQKRREHEQRWLEDILLEEGILDPTH